MNYWQYTLHTDPANSEILIAFLSDTDADTFEETESGVVAYLPESGDADALEQRLEDLRQQFDFQWDKTHVAAQNWNELWEHNFHPVIVGDFCAVRADFHPAIPGVQHELVINPKMAFGTGHHETTYLCMQALEHLPVQGARLLDFGCGTGILAILAARLGAAGVEAVDIEEESARNTMENSARNAVTTVVARQGSLDAVQGRDFDGILANINRNVILDSLPALAGLLKPGGWLLVSGILHADEPVVESAAAAVGFSKKWVERRGNWSAVLFGK